jgi:hypothetical protein
VSDERRGRFNSSKTRVVPIFDALVEMDPTGHAWLERLLRLPQRFDGSRAELPIDPGGLSERCWDGKSGGGEKRLDPPTPLLRWLIEHPPMSLSQLSPNDLSDTAKWRRRLAAGDDEARQKALHLLDAQTGRRRGWHIFEGPTSVDVYLATPTLIAVIEGKRTERTPTTSTEWMPVRHQLLRNLDGALEIANGRRVVGAFIVGATRQPTVPEEWQTMTDATISPAALAGSLPHRTAAERTQVADGYLGATTWGAVVQEFALPESLLDD